MELGALLTHFLSLSPPACIYVQVQEVSKSDAMMIAIRKGVDAFSGYATVRLYSEGGQ